MTIYVTEAPTGTIPHRTLANRFSLDAGSLVLHLPPEARRAGAIGLSILQTMGKDLKVTGGHAVRNDEHVKYPPLWAKAHGLTHASVLDGQRVTAAMAAHLRTLLGPDAQIVAVCETSTARRAHRLLNRDGADAEHLDWDAYLAEHPVLDVDGQADGALPDGYAFVHLPAVDFLVFRHTARVLNTPEVFADIDRDYVHAYKAATTIKPDIDSVLAHLDEITWPAHSTAPILVAIKATQAALLSRGWLLRARSDQLLGTLTSVRHPRPTERDWKALRAYIRPERSAAVALYLLGTPATELPSVTVAEIEQALRDGALNGHAIPPGARPLLSAELLRRNSEGHTGSAPFLTLPPGNPRRHLEFVIDARRDLDLPIDARNIRTTHSTHQTRVLYTLGLDLRSIA
jgi:hypothetical protein